MGINMNTERYRHAYDFGQKVVMLGRDVCGEITRVTLTAEGPRYTIESKGGPVGNLSREEIEDFDIWLESQR